jgi:hypothetical protein
MKMKIRMHLICSKSATTAGRKATQLLSSLQLLVFLLLLQCFFSIVSIFPCTSLLYRRWLRSFDSLGSFDWLAAMVFREGAYDSNNCLLNLIIVGPKQQTS